MICRSPPPARLTALGVDRIEVGSLRSRILFAERREIITAAGSIAGWLLKIERRPRSSRKSQPWLI